MKRIFLVLVLLNLAYLGWTVLRAPGADRPAAPHLPTSANRILLLSERDNMLASAEVPPAMRSVESGRGEPAPDEGKPAQEEPLAGAGADMLPAGPEPVQQVRDTESGPLPEGTGPETLPGEDTPAVDVGAELPRAASQTHFPYVASESGQRAPEPGELAAGLMTELQAPGDAVAAHPSRETSGADAALQPAAVEAGAEPPGLNPQIPAPVGEPQPEPVVPETGELAAGLKTELPAPGDAVTVHPLEGAPDLDAELRRSGMGTQGQPVESGSATTASEPESGKSAPEEKVPEGEVSEEAEPEELEAASEEIAPVELQSQTPGEGVGARPVEATEWSGEDQPGPVAAGSPPDGEPENGQPPDEGIETTHAAPSRTEEITTADAPAPPQPACYTLGPFEDESVARELEARLRSMGFEPGLRAISDRQPSKYWVYIPPLSSRTEAKALAQRLEEEGIEDYFIALKPPNRNAISLGLFRRQSGAQRRLEQIRKLGLEPELTVRYRERQIYWLDYVEWPDRTLDEGLWKGLAGDGAGVQRLARTCP